MTSSGEFNRLVTFERPIARQSEMGREPAQDWDELGRAWARVLFGTGAERRAAGLEQATQAATIRVRSTSMTRLVQATDRAWVEGGAWNVTGTAPIGVNDEIEITVVAGKG